MVRRWLPFPRPRNQSDPKPLDKDLVSAQAHASASATCSKQSGRSGSQRAKDRVAAHIGTRCLASLFFAGNHENMNILVTARVQKELPGRCGSGAARLESSWEYWG